MLNILLKIKFLLKKPKVVIVIGQERKAVKEAISQVLRQYFKLGQDVFIFETEEKKINKFTFFLKNSKLPILVINDAAEIFSTTELPQEAKVEMRFISSTKNLPANTYFILNCDEEKIKGVLDALDNFKTMKFGFKEKNDIFVSDIKVNGDTNFKINYKGKIVPFWLKGSYNDERIYAVLAAIGVATILGLNLVEISQSLREK